MMMRKIPANAPDTILLSQSKPLASVSLRMVKIGSMICAPFVTSAVGSTSIIFARMRSVPLVDAPSPTKRSRVPLMRNAPQ